MQRRCVLSRRELCPRRPLLARPRRRQLDSRTDGVRSARGRRHVRVGAGRGCERDSRAAQHRQAACAAIVCIRALADRHRLVGARLGVGGRRGRRARDRRGRARRAAARLCERGVRLCACAVRTRWRGRRRVPTRRHGPARLRARRLGRCARWRSAQLRERSTAQSRALLDLLLDALKCCGGREAAAAAAAAERTGAVGTVAAAGRAARGMLLRQLCQLLLLLLLLG